MTETTCGPKLQGNVAGLLEIKDEQVGNGGAGRGIQLLADASWVPLIEPGRRVVA
jgi:hypothetical protein